MSQDATQVAKTVLAQDMSDWRVSENYARESCKILAKAVQELEAARKEARMLITQSWPEISEASKAKWSVWLAKFT